MSKKIISVVLLSTATALTSLTGFTNVATAQPTPQTQNAAPRISVSQMASKLEQDGYHIREIEQKRYGWEVNVTDTNHDRLELRVNKQGNITAQKYDD
ncbi:PepSY domain-containing protein [Bartonella tamiae]|uniref:PepSY domain-containing protein n=1 Tax=Bartonella tamiae Th239 TaxID=1094558 RepID=J1JXE5_9HYPH|nr:PepSY domain-containing protein [Bartonella tamiae]EJF89290.1 hypothetical protein ME5_01841 [Bartonella tamiae Th239]EJF95548.1 hypothetical protein MEG_00038 [Bartonella tamiae Th307]